MEHVDAIIVGAGVVGLATAAELTRRFDDISVIVLEKHGWFGQETSSRNSEVIHAGMYYPSGSLKARTCVEGKKLLYDFCMKYNIPHQRIGKLIIAREETEISHIEAVMAQGIANGVEDLAMIDAKQVARLEPGIKAVAAIFSPSTGIIDSHKLMVQLESMAIKNSAFIAYKHELTGVDKIAAGYQVTFRCPDNSIDRLACRWLINCAGLAADFIPACLGIDITKSGYKIYLVKGEYFTIAAAKSKMLSHLVYPPPLKALKGLGIHVTKSLDGRARLGPSAFYVDSVNYDVDPLHADEFYQAASTYLPFLEPSDLQPDMAGIRPKIQAPDAPVADFVVCHEAERGLTGLINMIGIESPGLTACLSLAKMAADMMAEGDA